MTQKQASDVSNRAAPLSDDSRSHESDLVSRPQTVADLPPDLPSDPLPDFAEDAQWRQEMLEQHGRKISARTGRRAQIQARFDEAIASSHAHIEAAKAALADKPDSLGRIPKVKRPKLT